MALSVHTFDLGAALADQLRQYGFALVEGPHTHRLLLTDVLPRAARLLGQDVVWEETPSGWVVAAVVG